MTVLERFSPDTRTATEGVARAAFRAVLGDRYGATIVAVAFAWFGLYWRLGFFSTDQFVFANTLVGVLDGQLHVSRAIYGPSSGVTPGTYLVDDRVYGRNYGIVIASAVWLLGLNAASAVLDLRVLLLGAWLFAVVGTSTGIGLWLDRPRWGLLGGTAVATVLFAVNLLVATPFPSRWLPLLALQLTTAVAAALVGVTLYRLVGRVYPRRVAVAAGLVAVLGTPVGFWASLPKRHSVTAMLVVFAAYTLYRSRDTDSRRVATRFRALTYAWCGVAAWVHAAEGFILLIAIAAIDLPTARWNRPRDLAVVGAALLVSLLPFFATNALISGNPFRPPRLLPGYSGGVLGVTDADMATGASGVQPATDDAGASAARAVDPSVPVADWIALGVGTARTAVSRLLSQFDGSFGSLVSTPERVVRIFVRTGYVPTVRPSEDVAVNLSVLASMPLLGALVAVPLLVRRRLASAAAGTALRRPRTWSPYHVVDAFTLVYAFLLLGLFLRHLPVHHMLTVRYLHPLYALGVYWLVRIPAVRRTVLADPAAVAGSFLATILVGTGSYLLAIERANATLGEAVQLYALGALGVAATVALWSIVATSRGRYSRADAVVLGVGAGSVSVFLLVSGLGLFPVTGEFLLPAARVVAESIHYARLFGSTPPF